MASDMPTFTTNSAAPVAKHVAQRPAHSQATTPGTLLSTLSGLAAYITAIDDRGRRLLLAVAPHVGN